MKGLFSRGTCAALLACVLLTVRAEAETSIEIYAGGTPYLDTLANTVPVSPRALAIAPDGNLYVADEASGKILRFDPATSTVTSVPNLPGLLEFRFSSPQALGFSPGTLLNLMAVQEHWQLDLIDGFRMFRGPVGAAASVTFGPDASMYFSRPNEHAVYRRSYSGNIATVAGSALPGFSGDNTTVARFFNPRGVAIDAAGNIYIADSGNHRVRRRAVGTGIITTVAGTGGTTYNGENLLARQTNLSNPTLLAIDTAGNLYIYESGGHRIRRLNAATGRITNFAGNGSPSGIPGNGVPAIFASINGVADMKIAANGTLYIAETNSYRVRKIDASGIISQIIGNGTRSFCGEGVPAREACLNRPNGIAIDDAGDVYVSDQNNRRVRKISAATGLITTIAGANDTGPDGDGGPALAARLPNGPAGIAVDAARNIYVAAGGRVRRIDAATGIISAYAGTTTPGFSGDGGPAVAARLNGVSRLALDSSGNLYIADIYGNRVRRVDAATGIITTVAGTGIGDGPLGDYGPAIHASLGNPHTLVFDPDGNLLIGDTNHYRIRKLEIATGLISTVAGNGNAAIYGNGGQATSAGIGSWPAFDVDAAGNIYLAAGFELRRIDAQTGIIDRVPAPTWGLYTPEGRSLENPNDMVLGADNRLYITDADTNNLVLRVSGLPTPAIDLTPPVIEPIVSGMPGINGWYRSPVQIIWEITDPESGITTTSGCEPSQVDEDTDAEGITFQCTATSAGGTRNHSMVIKRDTVAPELTFGTPSPAPDASGWNSTDVLVPFNATDELSGVYSTSSGSPLTIEDEGMFLSAEVLVTDFAGNSTTFVTPAVHIDRTVAEITPNISGTLGNNGWYRSNVQLVWTVDEMAESIDWTSGCGTYNVNSDTTGISYTCGVQSVGGFTAKTVSIKRDATAPVVSITSPADGATYTVGESVTSSFGCTDEHMQTCTGAVANGLALDTSTAGTRTFTVDAVDLAGNTSTQVHAYTVQ